MVPTAVFRGLPLLAIAAPIPLTALLLVSFPPEARDAGWPCLPRRQFAVFGTAIEVQVSAGAVRQVPAASPVLFEDTTGQGHATRVLADGGTRALFLPVAD